MMLAKEEVSTVTFLSRSPAVRVTGLSLAALEHGNYTSSACEGC